MLVGQVARPRGLRGELVVNPVTDFPEARFAVGRRLLVRVGAEVSDRRIAAAWFQQGRPVITFEGVTTIEDAEPFVGAELRVTQDDLEALPPATFYHHDLVGCVVATRDGRVVGPVTAVEGESIGSRLVVASLRGEVLIPLVDAICTEVDVPGRRITIDPPAGLLDLDAAAEVGGPSAGRRDRHRRGPETQR